MKTIDELNDLTDEELLKLANKYHICTTTYEQEYFCGGSYVDLIELADKFIEKYGILKEDLSIDPASGYNEDEIVLSATVALNLQLPHVKNKLIKDVLIVMKKEEVEFNRKQTKFAEKQANELALYEKLKKKFEKK